jgi:hypothetical protein
MLQYKAVEQGKKFMKNYPPKYPIGVPSVPLPSGYYFLSIDKDAYPVIIKRIL